MSFKPIETQEEFDEAIKDRLAREKQTLEKDFAEQLEELKEEKATLKTQLAESNSNLEELGKSKDGHDATIEELNKKVSAYETAQLRTEIALENGIPYSLAERIQGKDKKSMKEDAKQLATYLGNSKPPAPLKSVEPENLSEQDGAYQSLLEGLNLEGE